MSTCSLLPLPVPRHYGLGIMAKHWLPGFVKTRLAADTNPSAAAEIHRLLTLHLTRSLGQCANQRVLFTTPASACPLVSAAVGPSWNVQPQCEGDLGQRMQAAFRILEQVSDETPVSMILIGADLPSVSPADLVQAFAALNHHDLVLGPATDGGYYLIGIKTDRPGESASKRCQNLFRGIPWSTETVFQKTIQVAQSEGLAVHLLDQRTDIDTLDDLQEALAAQSLAPELREQLTIILKAR